MINNLVVDYFRREVTPISRETTMAGRQQNMKFGQLLILDRYLPNCWSLSTIMV